MKKSYKVLLIIISVLLLFGLVTGYKYLYYNIFGDNMNRDDLIYIFNNLLSNTRYCRLKVSSYILNDNSD